MSKESNNVQGTRQLVSFTLAGEEYGLPILHVQEIIRFAKLTHIPQSSEYVEGVLNLRGRVIPVISLRRRLGLQEGQRDKATRIIVVEVDRHITGIIVDAVNEVRTVEEGQIEPPPPLGTNVDAENIEGMVKFEDRLIILLQVDQILLKDEETVTSEAAA